MFIRRIAPSDLLLAACLTATASTSLAANDLAPTSSRLVGSQLEIRDTSNDKAVLALTGVSMLDRFPVGVTSRIEATAKEGGSDITFTFKNVSSSPKRLGRILLGIFNLGSDIEYFNFRTSSQAEPARAQGFVGQAWLYPDDMYAPTTVIRNSEMAVGVSIQYPVLDYKHDVRFELASPGNWMEQGEAGRGWLLEIGLSNVGTEAAHTRLIREAQLAPDEERTYTVSIRTTKDPIHWQPTLVPYRDYFRSLYGGVQYTRRADPVAGMSLAEITSQSTSNRLSFRSDMRPDQRGFQPVVDTILAKEGWNSCMLWTVSGLYYTNTALNYPYQAGTNLRSTPQLETAFDPQHGLPAVRSAGKDLGIWWGRSVQMATRWDSEELIPFDPDNAEHTTIALRELDAIAATGANMVGLDTFVPKATPIWKLVPWLKFMQQRYPQMRFVTEPSGCDILHAMAPTFVWGNRYHDINSTNREDYFELKAPNTLADFLLPGHETWASFGYMNDYLRQFGKPSEAQIAQDVRKYADLGYRPVFWVDGSLPGSDSIRAAKSWEFTIPASVRDADPQIENLRNGREPTFGQPVGTAFAQASTPAGAQSPVVTPPSPAPGAAPAPAPTPAVIPPPRSSIVVVPSRLRGAQRQTAGRPPTSTTTTTTSTTPRTTTNTTPPSPARTATSTTPKATPPASTTRTRTVRGAARRPASSLATLPPD
jgi:hypothetical protein